MKDFDGLFFTESEAEIKALKLQVPSNNRIPETGWKPPTEFPMIRDAPWIGVDCETFDPELDEAGPGWARGRGHIVGVSISSPAGKFYYPIRHIVETHNNLPADKVFSYLRYILGGKAVKIGANLTYDIGWLRQEGVIVRGKLYDIQFAEALINETSDLALDDLGWKYLRRGKLTEVLKNWVLSAYKCAVTKWRKNIYRSPPSLVGPYAEDDADMPYHILKKQWPLLVANDLLRLLDMECRLIYLFVDMRFKGISVDLPYTEKLLKQFKERESILNKKACEIAGMPALNVDAAGSLAKAFTKLDIPYYNTAKTDKHPNGQPSFTGDFLKGARDQYGFSKLVVEIRALRKLCSTFLEGYILNNNVAGKVYTSFNQVKSERGGARTGRLSSDNPNLQNIPIRSEDAKLIRAAFIGDVGHVGMRDGDYSQVEYRMLAHFATGEGSEEVRATFCNDPLTDYHRFVGAMILEITGIDLIRGHIKNINFGSIYGVGKDHMAEMLGVELAKAIELLKTYHTALPYVKHTMRSVSADVETTGIVKTILGRISHFDEWEPKNFELRKGLVLPYAAAVREWGNDIERAGKYKAVNYKLQGSAAEVMKKGMLDCYDAGIFDETGVPRITVHDELLFSDSGDVREEAWLEMKHVMENTIKLKVPLIFDMTKGLNWATAH